MPDMADEHRPSVSHSTDTQMKSVSDSQGLELYPRPREISKLGSKSAPLPLKLKGLLTKPLIFARIVSLFKSILENLFLFRSIYEYRDFELRIDSFERVCQLRIYPRSSQLLAPRFEVPALATATSVDADRIQWPSMSSLSEGV